jgi:peptide/nickel transport system substrate-binding protein
MSRRLHIAISIPFIFALIAAPSTDTPAATPSKKTSSQLQSKSQAAPPQAGGTFTVIMSRSPTRFGYPPNIGGPDKDYSPPLFERLVSIGDGGGYEPQLATGWDIAPNGKAITFKLRNGVKFHDGTDFNAQAVKFNFDAIIPPKSTLLEGVTSVDVVDSHTVRVNLTNYDNLIFYQIAMSPYCNIASPAAIQKNGADWAMTHPVGTGPYKLEKLEPNSSTTLVKNQDYWDKGLPYLDKLQLNVVADPMTQLLAFKSGQADAIYDCTPSTAAQLKNEGWPLLVAPSAVFCLSFDSRNNKILGDKKVREAIEYAIDKDVLCSGPGFGLFKPIYQVVPASSPSYNKALPPRRYNPPKAKQLLAEAGYPAGFTFKATFLDALWRDGIVGIQAYLAQVGITMEINFVNNAYYNTNVRQGSKIEPGTAAGMGMENYGNFLYNMDAYFRSNSSQYKYVARPNLTDDLINKAKSLRKQEDAIPITREIAKVIYDDQTVVPLWMNPRIIVLGKSVHNAGWFVNGDAYLSKFGRSTWLER